MKLATLSFLAVTNLVLLTSLPAHAASFSFAPTGAPLDADAPPDLQLVPGQIISFATTIDTTGLPANLRSFTYQIVYDTTELEFVSSGRNLDEQSYFDFSLVPQTGGSGATFNRVAKNPPGTGVPVGLPLTLDTITFRVLDGLVNDGLVDFQVTGLSASTTTFQNVTASFATNQVISVQPVPEPFTMAGVGAAIGLGTFFKRKNSRKESN